MQEIWSHLEAMFCQSSVAQVCLRLIWYVSVLTGLLPTVGHAPGVKGVPTDRQKLDKDDATFI